MFRDFLLIFHYIVLHNEETWKQCVFKSIRFRLNQDIFSHIGVFILLSPGHTNPFSFENAYFWMRFRPSSALKRLKILKETTVYDAFCNTVFKSLRFYISTLETERFQKAPLLKPFSKTSDFISVFGRFRADDRQKRIKRYFIRKRISLVRTWEFTYNELSTTYHQGWTAREKSPDRNMARKSTITIK